MQKTKIEWCDYTWNPVKGLCPQACWYCYARAMYKRFKWDEGLRISYVELDKPMPKKPSRIFVGSTIDLFHPKIDPVWVRYILEKAELYPQHTFLFLTKNPARYAEFQFPDNCWLGVTVTKRYPDMEKMIWSQFKTTKNLRFISFEPLCGEVGIPVSKGEAVVDWVIVGAMTGAKKKWYQPEKKWIQTIVNTCFELRISLFLKNNLKAVWGPEKLIQEFPERRSR